MLKSRLKSGATSLGVFMKLTDPSVAEIAGRAGLDHIVIDMEHGPISYERAQELVRAAELGGAAATIRVACNDSSLILRALDVGAQGVHIPHISTVKDAMAAVAACYHHPHGERGLCRYVRAAGYTGRAVADFIQDASETVVPILHIEGVAGIDHLEEILKVPGVGVVFLGPYDLSQSCGVPGDVRHTLVTEKVAKAVAMAKAAGVAVGTFVETAADVQRWREAGVQYFCYSVDVGILFDAFGKIVKSVGNDTSEPEGILLRSV